MDQTVIELNYLPDGKASKGTLTAKAGEEILHVDKLDIRRAKARTTFVTTLTSRRPGIEANAIEDELRKLASKFTESARTPKSKDTKPVEITEALREAALSMLRNPELVRVIVDDVARLGVAGEKSLSITAYIVGTSRILSKPLAAIVQGLTSSGKSYVLDTVARLFPPETVIHAHRMTPEALYHLPKGDLIHKFVVAGERSRKQDDDTADATKALREMLSDGKLTKLIPQRNGNGLIETVRIEQPGPIAYIESTTLQKILDEDRNRCLILSTDEGSEQTKRVIDLCARYAESELNTDSVFNDIIERHHAAQRLLYKCRVRIPFAKKLAAAFPCERTDARRSFGQLLSFIKAVTLLHQYQRIDDPVDEVVIDATKEDYAIARRLLAEPMARSFGDGMSRAARNFADRLTEKFRDKEFDSRDAAKCETVIGDLQTIRSYLRELTRAGILEQMQESRGPKPARYRMAPVRDYVGEAGLPDPEEICSTVTPIYSRDNA